MVTFTEAFASESRTIAIDCDDVLCQTNETVAESELYTWRQLSVQVTEWVLR